MPTLDFKGKPFVHAHHLAVPYSTLEIDPAKSCVPSGRAPSLDDNLIIHGDNLRALKALLPTHAGKVDCIYIDPPYNTGNEKWCYNDAVNSPLMREWLKKASPVDKEDLERHDKWLCMMWPRLKIMRELLDEDGVLFVSIDDNEAASLKTILDEVFGEECFLAQFVWRKVDSPNDNKVAITPNHEFILAYGRFPDSSAFERFFDAGILDAYRQRDESGRLFRDRLLKKNGKNSLRRDRPTMFFPLTGPDGAEVLPLHENGEEARWSASISAIERHISEGTLIWKKRRKASGEVWEPYTREFAPDEPTKPHPTIWSDLPTMRQAKSMLRSMFGTADLFDTPKPIELLARLFELTGKKDGLVLDSFAGSGSTAHAVLQLNGRDGGNRRFILVECEDYADSLTAERVRRVINGYAFEGTQREELMSVPITWSKLKKADALMAQVEGIENLEGHRFDKITKAVKDGVLRVVGERKVRDRAEGIGGSFAYCELGPEISVEAMMEGGAMPDYDCMARYAFHTATGRTLDRAAGKPAKDWFIGETEDRRFHLLYKPDREWLRSADAALDARLAEAIGKARGGKRAVVFAAAKFMGQKELSRDHGIEFCQLPHSLHRITGD